MFSLHRGLQYFCLTCVSWLFLSEENVSELISEKEASLRVQVVQRGGGGKRKYDGENKWVAWLRSFKVKDEKIKKI